MAYDDPRKADPEKFIAGEEHVKGAQKEWKQYTPLAEYKLLHINENNGEWVTLDRIKKGAVLNRHLHKGAIRAYIIKGKFTYRTDRVLEPGDFLYEPLSAHHPATECLEDAEVISIYSGALEFLDDDDRTVSILDWEWYKRTEAGLDPVEVF